MLSKAEDFVQWTRCLDHIFFSQKETLQTRTMANGWKKRRILATIFAQIEQCIRRTENGNNFNHIAFGCDFLFVADILFE